MGLLDQFLRSSRPIYRAPRYLTQKRYGGTYPTGSARRVSLLTPNNLSLLPLAVYKNPLLYSPKSESNPYQDRRLWHPLGQNRPAVSKTEFRPRIEEQPFWHGDPVDPRTGVIKKLVPSKIHPSGYVYVDERPNVLEKWRMGYGDPWKVIICLKRQARKEVLHALNLAGKPGFKKPKYNSTSYVRCF